MSVKFNGKKQRRNPVTNVQKNLKLMEDQAKQYIQKNTTNLPPICSARHYLFYSLRKDQKKQNEQEIIPNTTTRPTMGKLLANKSLVIKKDQTIYQPTVYNVEFRNFASMHSQHSTSKVLLNSTSMRMKMNEDWRNSKKRLRYNNDESQEKEKSPRNRSKDKFTRVIMNANTIDLIDQKKLVTNFSKMFAPRMSKTDLVKRQSDILSNYYSRYIEPNQNYKRAKEVRKKRRDLSEIIQYNTINIERSSEQKDLVARRPINNKTIDNPQLIQTKKVPLYENEKEKGKKFSKKADAKPKKKEHNSLYTPWQNNTGQEFQQFLGIDRF